MGFKLFTTIFNANRVSEQTIVEKLLHSQRNVIAEAILEQGKELPPQLPAVRGSWFVEITKAHPSGIQMIFQNCMEEMGHPLLQWDQIPYILSKEIPDEPFILVSYSSVVDTGSCSVYMNGEVVEESSSREGDDGAGMTPVLQKYFPIKREVFPILKEWSRNNSLYNDYTISSYVAMKRVGDKGPTEDNFMYDWFTAEMNAIELFKKNPKMTQKEWKDNKERGTDIGYDMSKHAYELYLYHVNKAYGSNLYAMTEGHLFDENGVWLLEQPVWVEPLTWFDLRDEAKNALRKRKNEVYGEAPPSYTLTKEELATLSYEEQKAEAYKRFMIAKKRRETMGGFHGNYYASGIQVQVPFEKGQYILFNDEYLYVKRTSLIACKHSETFIEEIQAVKYLPEQNAAQHRNIELHDFPKVTIVEEKDVPETAILPEVYKK